MKEQMLTPEDADKLLQLALALLRGWLRKGILQYNNKVGGGKFWRISEEAISDFMQAGYGV